LDIGDSDNLTALHLATARGHYKVAKMLLDAGVEVNRKTSDKTSALHIAASRGYIDTVEVLLDGGANIDSLDSSDRTPLFLAVSRGHDDVVALLIKHGAKVNIEEIHGYTPLCEAVWQKMVPLVQILLDAGAKITQSHFLLHYAIMHRHTEMAELLLKAGSIVNLRDDNGDSPLIVAARTGICQLVELLLRNGADVNYPNALTGSMPLHEAVEFIRDSKYSTFESMFHILRSYGAILNVQTCTGGDTPLFRAILLEKDKAAVLLIRHGTDVNLCDVEACVVDNLRLARKRNNFRLAQMIVYAGFDLQHCTPDLKPPRKSNSLSLDSLRDWLTYMKFNPMRLTELCRLVIRAQLRERVYEKITSSYLPLSLKKYVLLEDLDVCG
jgi:ankyrin repeat protein